MSRLNKNSLFKMIPLIIETYKRKKRIIDCFGDSYCKAVWLSWTQRHAKLPILKKKEFGVALHLLNVPKEKLFSGQRCETMRNLANRAERSGYRVQKIDPANFLEAIILINTSASSRQDRPMDESYTLQERVSDYSRSPGNWYGVFDRGNNLRAYCHAPIVGDVYCYSRIMGDHNFLKDGIMYLLIRETTFDMWEHLERNGFPNWAMYDTFFGGSEGLRGFKSRTGFDPFWVEWRWIER
jgi:hypothetical protein